MVTHGRPFIVLVYMYLCLQAACLVDGQTWSILPSTVLLRDTGSGQNYSFECRSDPPSQLQLRWVVRRGNFPSQAIVTSGEQNQFLMLTNVMYEMRFVPRFDIRCWQDTRLVAIAEVTVDENECRQDDYCSSLGISNAICSDVVGGANCSCREGFQNTTCVDIDECSPTGGHNCSRSASCTNLPGKFSCQCIDGFTGDGHVCADVDECAAGLHSCPPLQECVNTEGTHSCSLILGSGSGLVPTAASDQCSKGGHNCPEDISQCVNTTGTPSCLCATGYTGKGRDCYNIDECQTIKNVCPRDDQRCVDIKGSFECQCQIGYTGNSTVCGDIDECLVPRHVCLVGMVCVNTIGSFSCRCPTGFARNVTDPNSFCEDVDECVSTAACGSPVSQCANRIGTYQCTCANGTVLLGRSCGAGPEPSSSSNSLPIGIAVAVAVLALLALILGLVCLYRRRGDIQRVTMSQGKLKSSLSTEGLTISNPDYQQPRSIAVVCPGSNSRLPHSNAANRPNAQPHNAAQRTGQQSQPDHEYDVIAVPSVLSGAPTTSSNRDAHARPSADGNASEMAFRHDLPVSHQSVNVSAQLPNNTSAMQPGDTNYEQARHDIDTSPNLYSHATLVSVPKAANAKSGLQETSSSGHAVSNGDNFASGYKSISRAEQNEYEHPALPNTQTTTSSQRVGSICTYQQLTAVPPASHYASNYASPRSTKEANRSSDSRAVLEASSEYVYSSAGWLHGAKT